MKNRIIERNFTDDIGNVEAVGEAAGGAVRRVVDAVRRRIRPRGGDQVVVVAVIHQGVSKHKECLSFCIGVQIPHCQNDKKNSTNSWILHETCSHFH